MTRDARPLRAADRDKILRSAVHRLHHATTTPADLDTDRSPLAAARYDGSRPTGVTSDPTGETATARHGMSRAAYDAALRRLEAVVDEITAVHGTPPAPPTSNVRRPGIGPCSKGRCRDHWEAGIIMRAGKRWVSLCNRCGRHRDKWGCSMPPAVIRAIDAADGDDKHWSVIRAWEALGMDPPCRWRKVDPPPANPTTQENADPATDTDAPAMVRDQ